jgi:hypothetical protein
LLFIYLLLLFIIFPLFPITSLSSSSRLFDNTWALPHRVFELSFLLTNCNWFCYFAQAIFEEDVMTKLQKDHLMILLESMDSKMRITVEAVGSLNDKIDGVESRLNARIDHVDSIIRVTIDEVASLHKKVDAVEKNLSERIDAVYKELVAHRNDTESHRSQPKRSLKRVV